MTSILASLLSRGADVGDPEAQIRAAIIGNLSIRRRKGIPILPRFSLHDKWYSGKMEKGNESIHIRDGKTCTAFSILRSPSICSPFLEILEVAKGIEYIHSEGVVHGDLRGVSYRIERTISEY